MLFALALVTLIAGWRLPELSIQIDADGLAIEGDAEMRWLNYVRGAYGGEDSILVLFSGEDLFAPESLELLRATHFTLAALPDVESVTSLANANDVKVVDDELILKPYLADIPQSAQAIAALRAALRANPIVNGNLVAEDGRAVLMLLELAPDDRRRLGDEGLVQSIETVLDPLKARFQRVFQLGGPYVSQQIAGQIRDDQVQILPWALAVLLLTLALGFRRIESALIPAVTAGTSVVWTLGVMAWSGTPINVMTSIVPALLIIIGSTEDVHLLADYLKHRAAGEGRSQALDAMASRMSTPITLTFATTYVGFLSIATQDIGALREFGLLASTGLAFNFLITLVAVPALLCVLPLPGLRSAGSGARVVGQAVLALSNAAAHHKRVTAIIIVGICALSAYGAMDLRVNNNNLDYFESDSELHRRISAVNQAVGGAYTLSVVLRSGIEGTFRKVRYLREVAKLQQFIRATGQFGQTSSFADLMGYVHQLMQEYPPGTTDLPEEDELMAEYLLFLESADYASFVNPEMSETRIVVRHAIADSTALLTAEAAISRYAREHIDPGLEVHVTGAEIVTARAANTMAQGQARSIGFMAVVIGIVVGVLFFSIKAGIVGMIPNLFPIAALFGVMGFAGISVDTATSMVAVIALGICVDDTMHFMARYHQHTRGGIDHDEALRATILDEALPIVSTSIALALGFAVLALSEFPPVRNFGLLSAMVMLLALVSTFVVTPVLLTSIPLIGIWDLLSLRLKSAVLESCPLFIEMSTWQIKKLVLSSDVREYPTDIRVVTQGETGDAMYVVLRGRARALRRSADGNRHALRDFEAGDVFGEMALVTRAPRSADVVVVEELQVLVLRWDDIRSVMRLFPRLSSRLFFNLSVILSRRLDATANGGTSPARSPG